MGDRNKVVYSTPIPLVEYRCVWIVDYLDSFGKIPYDEPSCSQLPFHTRYDLMDNNLSIIHYDAVIQLGEHIVGIGGGVGSSSGQTIASLSGFKDFFGNVLYAEAFVVLEGLHLA